MTDLYLKFTDEAAATAVLYTLHPEVTDEQGTVVADAYTTANYANISTIGIIYKPTGETDAEGNPVMAALDGWHVNVRVVGEDPTPLEQYAVVPTLPVRVWG